MRPLLTLGLLALYACHSDLSGPEAQRLAQALQDPWSGTSRSHLEDLWSRIGGRPFRPDSINPGASIELRLDGVRIPARAFVFQLVLEGQGVLPAPCQGDRFTLLAWTLEDSSRALILAGGDFTQPLAPPASCDGLGVLSRRPVLSLRPLSGPEGPVAFAEAGSASIRPLGSRDGCPFVGSEAMAYLRSRGIRCTRGSYAATATATLRSDSVPGGVTEVGLPRGELPGVRWVVDCSQSQEYVLLCGPQGTPATSGG